MTVSESPARIPAIPWDSIETLFLDAGNTLISVDFDWVSDVLIERGYPCSPVTLERAEAAARPAVSHWIAGRSTEGMDSFSYYLTQVLGKLDSLASLGADRLTALAADLAPTLRSPGQADRLWSRVMPGVPEALTALRGFGFKLVVVSNSDGSVERGLTAVGLRGHLDAVVDSARVGAEKPDPRIFEAALASAGTPPDRALHVGDLFHADVLGARAAGVHAVLLDPFDDWGDVGCERVENLSRLVERFSHSRGV